MRVLNGILVIMFIISASFAKVNADDMNLQNNSPLYEDEVQTNSMDVDQEYYYNTITEDDEGYVTEDIIYEPYLLSENYEENDDYYEYPDTK